MSSLAPSFLLSMPQLLDPNFSRTVVLLCKHSEDGAFGLVVNRPLVTTGPVVVEVRAPSDAVGHKTEVSEHELQVWVGGPVEPQSSWILDGARQRYRRGAAWRARRRGFVPVDVARICCTGCSARRRRHARD